MLPVDAARGCCPLSSLDILTPNTAAADTIPLAGLTSEDAIKARESAVAKLGTALAKLG